MRRPNPVLEELIERGGIKPSLRLDYEAWQRLVRGFEKPWVELAAEYDVLFAAMVRERGHTHASLANRWGWTELHVRRLFGTDFWWLQNDSRAVILRDRLTEGSGFLGLEALLRCESAMEVKLGIELVKEDLLLQTQVPIGRWRVDFLINQTVVVECDGHDFHASRDQRARDADRDLELGTMGLHVARFTGSQIDRDAPGCVRKVVEFVRATS